VPVERTEAGAGGRARGGGEPEPVADGAAVGAHERAIRVPAEERLHERLVALEAAGRQQHGAGADLLPARDDTAHPALVEQQRLHRRVQPQVADLSSPVRVQRVDVGAVGDAEAEVLRPALADRHARVAGRRHRGLEALDQDAPELGIPVGEQRRQRGDVRRGPQNPGGEIG
jgi:hypothetical protein